MVNNRTQKNRSIDVHFCFFIQDFEEGDSIIVIRNKQRVKGRVMGVDREENIVYWMDKERKVQSSVLDEFSYLGPFDQGWI